MKKNTSEEHIAFMLYSEDTSTIVLWNTSNSLSDSKVSGEEWSHVKHICGGKTIKLQVHGFHYMKK
jgi:hypothetical protein